MGAPEYDFTTYKGYWGIFLGDTNIIVTDVESEIASTPENFHLYQNYPNPFNPVTKIKYVIARGTKQSQHITLKVYDILGKEIATLIDKEQNAGKYEIEFDASHLSSGVYFYQLRAKSFVVTKKMILLR